MKATHKRVHRTLKRYFIPHRANRYHPHILHTKHVLRSSIAFLALKVFLVAFAFFIPAEAFVAPDVLLQQGQRLIAMTNEVRAQNNLPPLKTNSPLTHSAQMRADDMNEQQYFSHRSPDGHGVNYFVSRSGYNYSVTGENLAMGFSDANALMGAWMKSPTHYANLIDKDYEDFGIGMVGGVYQGKPTVFVAQHFGLPYRALPNEVPQVKPAPTPSKPNPDGSQIAKAPLPRPVAVKPTTKPVALASVPKVMAHIEPASRPVQPLEVPPVEPQKTPEIPSVIEEPVASVDLFDESNSSLTWEDVAEGKTKIHVAANFISPVLSARLQVDGYTISLTQRAGREYIGSLVVPESSDELFRVVIPGTISYISADGKPYEAVLDWQQPKTVSETPWQKYLQAKSWLSGTIPVFSLVRWVYILGLIFFGFALGLNIVIEFRKQHPHVILKTSALLALLVLLIRY